MKLSKYIDHTKLNPCSTVSEFDQLINEAIEYGFFSVCVPPHIVKHTKEKLSKTQVKVCSVAGFPNGYTTLRNKKHEIEELFEIGCDEVDVVLNIANVKSGSWDLVLEEFTVFSELSKANTLKVIIESGLLTKSEVVKVCEIANEKPVDFLKTSTGFAAKNASVEAVVTMRAHLKSNIKIKASGGIRTKAQAETFIEVGADRLGCSSGVKIINQEDSKEEHENGNISSSSY